MDYSRVERGDVRLVLPRLLMSLHNWALSYWIV